ncbi:MAG: hypothetical protein FJZ58_08495 [Chlamydiae bacterium]|nr:hypothetical protein [Chlamydiota bacterium]
MTCLSILCCGSTASATKPIYHASNSIESSAVIVPQKRVRFQEMSHPPSCHCSQIFCKAFSPSPIEEWDLEKIEFFVERKLKKTGKGKPAFDYPRFGNEIRNIAGYFADLLRDPESHRIKTIDEFIAALTSLCSRDRIAQGVSSYEPSFIGFDDEDEDPIQINPCLMIVVETLIRKERRLQNAMKHFLPHLKLPTLWEQICYTPKDLPTSSPPSSTTSVPKEQSQQQMRVWTFTVPILT